MECDKKSNLETWNALFTLLLQLFELWSYFYLSMTNKRGCVIFIRKFPLFATCLQWINIAILLPSDTPDIKKYIRDADAVLCCLAVCIQFKECKHCAKKMEFLTWDKRDLRVENWGLMSSICPTILLSVSYWIFCLFLGPNLMKNRPEVNVKFPMQIYNVISVLTSAYLFYEAGVFWFSYYDYKCQPIEEGQKGLRMAEAFHLYFLSKFFEFFDTFFFIARKKFSHVSKLQLIHHGIMPIYSWILCRFAPGGQESFGLLLNSLVHVVMYSYYFLAAFGPKFKKYLWWKRYLTTMQMVQFVCVFVKSLLVVFVYHDSCGYPWQFSALSCLLMILMFYLFAEFYVQEYVQKRNMAKVKWFFFLSRNKVDF